MDFSDIFSGFSRTLPGFFSGVEKSIFYAFFTIKKLIFKKKSGNLGISSETTWESRVKRPEKAVCDRCEEVSTGVQ